MNPSLVRIMKTRSPAAGAAGGKEENGAEEDADLSIDRRLDQVFALYEKHGEINYVGEAVTQLQHAQQVAQFARDACQPIHVILGAFFHDIGHLVGIERHMQKMTEHGLTMKGSSTSIGTRIHERVGKEYLQEMGFPKCVTELVESHVNGKRYLVYRSKHYHSQLSRASQMTLKHQGGPMTEEEAVAFEKSDNFNTILDLRRWDDEGKNPNIPVHDNGYYREACKKLLVACRTLQSQDSNE